VRKTGFEFLEVREHELELGWRRGRGIEILWQLRLVLKAVWLAGKQAPSSRKWGAQTLRTAHSRPCLPGPISSCRFSRGNRPIGSPWYVTDIDTRQRLERNKSRRGKVFQNDCIFRTLIQISALQHKGAIFTIKCALSPVLRILLRRLLNWLQRFPVPRRFFTHVLDHQTTETSRTYRITGCCNRSPGYRREVSSITPAKAAFGVVKEILIMVKARFPLLCVGGLRAEMGIGLYDERR